MALKSVFEQGVETAFKTFDDAVHEGSYVIDNDDGFTDEEDNTNDIRVILDEWTEEDRSSSLYKLVQPTDVKGMVPGKDITLVMESGNIVNADGKRFTIVGFETDPYKVLYTLLLRTG